LEYVSLMVRMKWTEWTDGEDTFERLSEWCVDFLFYCSCLPIHKVGRRS
jgi:hypothetical protein